MSRIWIVGKGYVVASGTHDQQLGFVETLKKSVFETLAIDNANSSLITVGGIDLASVKICTTNDAGEDIEILRAAEIGHR